MNRKRDPRDLPWYNERNPMPPPPPPPVAQGSEYTCDNVALCGTATTGMLTTPPAGWFVGQGGLVGNPSKQRVICPTCIGAAAAACPALTA